MASQMTFPTIHVFTDIGVEDTDDELGVKYLLNFKDPLNVLIVFTGSASMSAGNALAYWVRSFESTVLSKLTPGTTFAYTTLSDYAAAAGNCCDYALQIGPLKDYDGENMSVNKNYVFAGDYKTPAGARPSFNRTGSEKILDKFFKEGKLVDIPSTHMVKMRFNKDLLSKFSTDTEDPFACNIVFTAFLLIFARMSPDHVACKFAEGLVNPNCGRGANYVSVMKMKEKLNLTNDLKPPAAYAAAMEYCDDLIANGVVLKDRRGTVKHLTEINDVLQAISNVSVGLEENYRSLFGSSEAPRKVFVSDFDIDSVPDALLPSWEFFKKNSTMFIDAFNPVYDLFAAYVMTGLMVGENRVTHSPEEFLKNVVSEF